MSKSLSELFSSGDRIGLPKDDSSLKQDPVYIDVYGTKKNPKVSTNTRYTTAESIPDNVGEPYDPSIRSGSWLESGGTAALSKDLENRAWKILGDTLSHYPHITSTPEAALRLFGGGISIPMGKVGTIIDGVSNILGQGDIIGGQYNTVPIPPYMSKEDGALVNWAVNTIIGSIRTSNGNLPKPNYELIFRSLTSSNIINKLTEEFLAKEFEKGRWPARMPYSDNPDSNQFYLSGTIGGLIEDNVLGTINKWLGKPSTEYDENNRSIRVLDNSSEVIKYTSTQADYFGYNDPYDTTDSVIPGNTIGDAIKFLREKNLLAGYKDFAGFEIGSNHMWNITIYPYPHSKNVVDLYKQLDRRPVTPALPVYAVPNMWRKIPEVKSSVPDPSGLNSVKSEAIPYVTERLTSYLEGETGGTIRITRDDLYNKDRVFFSFSSHTPVLSYDLNLGTIRTDSLKLFNGSQSEIFMGMNYNPIMNISILDDVYGSMFKYMQQYTNCAYDIHSHSLAPYYNCAFEICLTILRAGGQINHRFKFIGVPIDYTPRLEGSSEANELRVDIVFSIIGFIPYGEPDALTKRVYQNNMGGRAVDSNEGTIDPFEGSDGRNNNLGDLRWGDIQIKLS